MQNNVLQSTECNARGTAHMCFRWTRKSRGAELVPCLTAFLWPNSGKGLQSSSDKRARAPCRSSACGGGKAAAAAAFHSCAHAATWSLTAARMQLQGQLKLHLCNVSAFKVIHPLTAARLQRLSH